MSYKEEKFGPLIILLCFSGLFSTVMRDLANINNDSPKWIVLDGDIDPMWIESLNTVMDDNKVNAAEYFLYFVITHHDFQK